MAKPDGGPAFPRPFSEPVSGDDSDRAYAQDGMTLRDYFAGQALQGMLAAARTPKERSGQPERKTAAAWAYEWADAMIVVRDR